jgi:hypothetical protein
MAYLLAGPLVALIGVGAVFFVLRRKSVDKRSMYSARRSQIEHKVRAARQRTLAPHGHAPKPAEAAPSPVATMEQQAMQPTMVWEKPAYEAPPVAPPPAPAPTPAAPAEPPPWEQPSIPASAPAPSSFDFPAAQPEPFTPTSEPTPMPSPIEPVWTPAPEPMPPAETMAPAASAVAPAATSTSVGGWSIVSTEKDSSVSAEPSGKKKKKDKGGAPSDAWALASGEAPGAEAEDEPGKLPSGTIRAVAQYAVLVVGLVMVLIGVLVMVANSHVT